MLSFELPYFKFHEIDDKVIEELQHSWNGTNIIGKPVLIDAGPKWAVFQLGSGKEVLDLNVDLAQIERLSLENGWTGIGVFGKHNENGDSVELRNIAPAVGSLKILLEVDQVLLEHIWQITFSMKRKNLQLIFLKVNQLKEMLRFKLKLIVLAPKMVIYLFMLVVMPSLVSKVLILFKT